MVSGTTRGIFLLTILGLLVLLGVGSAKYSSYVSKLSNKDFAATSVTAERALTGVSRSKVSKNESCRYTRPEVYSSLVLFCGVEMVTYIPHISE